MRHAGHIWASDGEGYESQVGDRFLVHTWPFGNIHQCKIYVNYQYAHKIDRPYVGVCLRGAGTRREAMRKGVEWVEKYIALGPPSHETLFLDCYEHYPTLFRHRYQVLNQLFCTLGGGYAWLDGAIANTNPEDHLEPRRSGLEELRGKLSPEIEAILFPPDPPPGPVPDPEGPLIFSEPHQDYANIYHVPEDVTPAWLTLALETATLLRDRAATKKNREHGRILIDLITQMGIVDLRATEIRKELDE